MKKAIITLAITAFITVSVLAYIQPSTSPEVLSRNNASSAKAEFYNSIDDSLQILNKESETKIGKYEASISEYKSRIINEKKEHTNKIAKKLAELTK